MVGIMVWELVYSIINSIYFILKWIICRVIFLIRSKLMEDIVLVFKCGIDKFLNDVENC